jgi:hypothetical protein
MTTGPRTRRWQRLINLSITVNLVAIAGCGVEPGSPVETRVAALTTCTPGDQAVCHWMGACNAAGNACVCTDPQHWWASEDCATWHSGPMPVPGQVLHTRRSGVLQLEWHVQRDGVRLHLHRPAALVGFRALLHLARDAAAVVGPGVRAG